jgi:hypothetical protein
VVVDVGGNAVALQQEKKKLVKQDKRFKRYNHEDLLKKQ